MKTPIRLYNKWWLLCFLARLSLSCKISSRFLHGWLLNKQHTLSASTVLHVVNWSGSFATSQVGAVKGWWPSCVSDIVISEDDNSFKSVIQVVFVWLVICSRSSSWIKIDDTLLVGSIELRIHVCGDAKHVYPSCSNLCCKAYQHLFWLVSGLFALKSMLDIYHGLSYKHPCRIARVWILPLFIPYLGVEYIFVSRLNQYQKYVVKCIVTDATLTLWGFGWSSRCARLPWKGEFIRLFINQSIDVFQIFYHASVEMYEIFIT